MSKVEDFSNHYSWKIFFTTCFLLFLVFITELAYCYMYDYRGNIVFHLLMLLNSIVVIIGPVLNICRNKYYISGDYLMFEEYTWFRSSLKAEVAIKDIRSAEIVWTRHYLRKVVRIHTSNDYIDLLCTTHRQELVNRLNDLSNHNNEQCC